MKLGKAKRLPPRPPSPDEVSDGEQEEKSEVEHQSTPPSFSFSSSPPTTTATTPPPEPILSSPNRISSAVEFTSPTRRKQNLEPGDDEEFEIMDFHLASSWERFIATIEKTLRSWGLHNGGNGNGETTQPLVQNISYAHRQYQLSLHLNASGIESSPSPSSSSSSSFFFSSLSPFSTSLSPSLHHMMDLEGDFPSRAHHLTRWFGVREFLIISPLSDVGADLSEASLLLSSLTIATQNSSCHVPVFVPVKERWKGVYIGYCAWNGLTTHLECECLPSIPGSFISQTYLSALMKSFASKLGTIGDPNEKISLSLRQTHMRQGYSERNWRTCLLNITPPNFPWGPSADPVEALHLALSWRKEFDYWSEDGLSLQVPEEQPQGGIERSKWLLRCIYNDKLQYLLTRCIQNVLQAYAETDNFATMEQIQPPSAITETATGPKLLNAVETFTRSITAGWSSFYLPTPAEVEAIVGDIFDPSKQIDPQGGDMYLPVKSVPPGSLAADLVLSMLNMAGLKAFAMVWSEFKRVVRNHWERALPLPRVTPLPVDFRTCLLYQKLQMLNHCISHERLRVQQGVMTDPDLLHTVRTEPKPCPQTDSGEDLVEKEVDSPDEWDTGEGGWDFDGPLEEEQRKESGEEEEEKKKEAGEGQEEGQGEGQEAKEIEKNETSSASLPTDAEEKSQVKREGVKPNYDTGLRLLKTGEPLSAPITQEHAVMTEDMIMEQEELFTNQDTEAIRHHMSKTLLSDMEAFKAANPDCILEDFVRWYSPNDWLQADPKTEASLETGQLSKRMKEPGNLWQKSWEDAQPVPISRQKPLFNHRTEAEKVLHFLENITPGELVGQFLLIALTTVHHRLFMLPSAGLEIVAKAIDRFGDVLRETGNTGVQEREVILRSLMEAEVLSARATSLLDKLGRRQSLVAKLLLAGEAELSGGTDERQLAIRYISPDNGRLPEPDAREFILRAWVPRPFPGSRNVPNRLYALITNYEFRVATVTSLDE